MNLYLLKKAKSHRKNHYPMVFVPEGVPNVNTKRGKKKINDHLKKGLRAVAMDYR